MKETNRSALPIGSVGLARIENDKEKSPAPVTTGDPKSSYPELLQSWDLIGSESMRLIDESAKNLHERIKDASNVEACLCAKQIAELLRLKLDVRRITRD